MKRALLICSLLMATSALATTYVRVEPDGTKTYSDRPIPGGKPVDVQPAQTYSAPPTAPPVNPSMSREERDVMSAANFKYACALTPRADETFQNPEAVTIGVQLTPTLRPGDRVDFTIDGSKVENSGNTTGTVMQNPDRGSHTVQVSVVDRSGKSVCNISSTFFVQRTGVNSPARQTPNRPRPNPPRPTPH